MSDPIQPDEFQLFREHVADTIPIKSEYIEQFYHRPPPRPLPKSQNFNNVTKNTSITESEVITENFLDFYRPGVQLKLLQKLRQGHIEPQMELDLHGLNVVYAEETLKAFLIKCRKNTLRCIRIIHGKGAAHKDGQPSILKCKVNYWLRCYDDVLAFTSAPRWDGGTGAVYVLLRNSQKTSL